MEPSRGCGARGRDARSGCPAGMDWLLLLPPSSSFALLLLLLPPFAGV